jgi:hypothetical protein
LALFINAVGVFTAVIVYWGKEKHDGAAEYRMAVQSLVEVKGAFAERPSLFDRELYRATAPARREGKVAGHVPRGMPAEDFLPFAASMWRLSYAYGIKQRAKGLDIQPEDAAALGREVDLWLGLPGFKEVYLHHSRPNQVLPNGFLEHLNELYRGESLPDCSCATNHPPRRRPRFARTAGRIT